MLLLWLKTLHIVAVVCWFAGLFYLPRLFVYHAMSEDILGRERFVVMERKLYRGIMTPSALATAIFGLWMVHLNQDYYSSAPWLRIKLVLVAALFCYHAACGRFVRGFADGTNRRSHTFYRIFNELPVMLLVAIIALAVIKPYW